jgi:hypothetical protein
MLIKIADFGCSEQYKGSNADFKQERDQSFTTQAYSPLEAFHKYKGVPPKP